jgi:uncharacterized protein YoxC
MLLEIIVIALVVTCITLICYLLHMIKKTNRRLDTYKETTALMFANTEMRAVILRKRTTRNHNNIRKLRQQLHLGGLDLRIDERVRMEQYLYDVIN